MRDEFRTCLDVQVTTKLLTECKRNVETGDVKAYPPPPPVNSAVKIVEENYSESVTIVRRQRFEGGFHIRKKYSKK